MGINNITADAIEMMRARLLLLGEPPQLNERSAQSLVSGFVTMVGQDRIDGSTFPKLWVDSSGDLVKFLRFPRLSAVFWLKKTNACQAILELCLGPIGFRGRREKDWSEKSISIAVEGDCSPELMSGV